MNTALFNELIPHIRRLLHREHEPIVTKKISKVLRNAGQGVFTTTTVLKGEVCEAYVIPYISFLSEILNRFFLMEFTLNDFLYFIIYRSFVYTLASTAQVSVVLLLLLPYNTDNSFH